MIRAMCPCGYPFNPDVRYDGVTPWSQRRPRRWCSKRCSRSIPALWRRVEQRAEKARHLLRAQEAAGQLTLW